MNAARKFRSAMWHWVRLTLTCGCPSGLWAPRVVASSNMFWLLAVPGVRLRTMAPRFQPTQVVADHGRGLKVVRSRVELFAAIRRDARVEECSIRELADRYHVHRRTVRQALASAVPPPRKTPARMSPRLEPFKTAIDDMLRSDLDAPKKQRHTARRILARLVDEHDATDLSYSTVRDYVAQAPTGDRRRGGQAAGVGLRAADPSAGGRGRGGLP